MAYLLFLRKRIFFAAAILFVSLLPAAAQSSRLEIGVMGGTNFYIGEKNKVPFDAFEPAFGGFFRVNFDPRWTLKTQVAVASLRHAIEQSYIDFSSRIEFHFYEYGRPSYAENKLYIFTPYIFAGFGFTSYESDYGQGSFTANFPFGLGVKLKLFRRMNIGLEWSMHKLFTDKFDYVDNPNQLKKSVFYNNDWYSIASFFVSFDLIHTAWRCRR